MSNEPPNPPAPLSNLDSEIVALRQVVEALQRLPEDRRFIIVTSAAIIAGVLRPITNHQYPPSP